MFIDSRGFTLTEALATLAVAACLAALAVPALTRLAEERRLQATSENLSAALAYARSESIKRRCPVLVAAIEGEWMRGWQVFADLNEDGRLNPEEPLLLEAAAPPDGTVVRGNTPVRRYLRYTPDGSTRMLSGAFQAGTLRICHLSGELSVRQLVISATGRLRRTKTPADHC